MPNHSIRPLVILVALCLALPTAQAEGHKIGVLLKGRTKFWSAVEQGAMAAGEKLGVEVTVKTPPTESDVSAQILMLNALAKQGVEAIILVPINKETLAKPAAALAAQGIKIIVLDSPLDGDIASTFIGTNHRSAGVAAGELLKTLVTENDQVSLFRHSQDNAATNNRETGAVEKLREAYPKIVVYSDVFAGNEKELQAERAKLLLSKHPATKLILASSTPATMAMLEVLAHHEPLGEIKLVGFGFNLNEEVSAALEAGILHGWVAQQPKEIGYQGVVTAVDLLNGKTVPPVHSIDVFIVTKGNLHDPKSQALLKL
jgi:ribose transport system substrate-binding protein